MLLESDVTGICPEIVPSQFAQRYSTISDLPEQWVTIIILYVANLTGFRLGHPAKADMAKWLYKSAA